MYRVEEDIMGLEEGGTLLMDNLRLPFVVCIYIYAS